MITSLIFRIVIFGAVILALACGFFIWLTKRKSAEDRRAFSEVLNTDTVKTFYKPEEYVSAANKNDRTDSDN